jgi:diadenosine tetraphosphatase ApaH/serine/threonine PP2A family protein phosphatase
MRALVISDIHANFSALEAVLADAGAVDAVWCLGDIVGYGPDPNECVERLHALPNLVSIFGNHDAAVMDLIDVDAFNNEARQTIQWTRQVLTRPNLTFLTELSETQVLAEVTLAHGSPRQPVWEYLLDGRSAAQNFTLFDTPYCLVGHTHLPIIFTLENGAQLARQRIPDPDQRIELPARAIFNPGSVGQPRDRDPRAAYAIFDDEAHCWETHRVEYDIPSVQIRMRRINLPNRHVQRLAAGW